MARLFWICLAGALGSGARYLVGLAAARLLGTAFPWGTLLVNGVGSALMSMVAYAGAKAVLSADLRLVLATGFLGGLTTYSAYNQQTVEFLQARAWGLGLANVALTLTLFLVAAGLGLALARALLGA